MCMHWLKYIKVNRKDRLKIMHGTALEVAILADIRETHSAIYQCLPKGTFPTFY